MRRIRASGLFLAAIFVAGVLPGRLEAQQASRAQALIEEHLYGGTLEAGEKALRDLVTGTPSDAAHAARFRQVLAAIYEDLGLAAASPA